MSEERGEHGQDMINAKFNDTPVPMQQEDIYVDNVAFSAAIGECVHIFITYTQSASGVAACSVCDRRQFAFYAGSILQGLHLVLQSVQHWTRNSDE